MSRFSIACRRVLFGLIFATVAAFSACGGGGSPATPTPTVPPPVLATVPPGTVVDLNHAAELYHEGDYDGALAIYSAAALNGTPTQKQAGLLAVARIHNEQGDHKAAAQTVQAYRGTAPPAEQDRQALLLLGNASQQDGDMATARSAFEEYLKQAGPAAPYAEIALAAIDAQEIKLDSAIDRLTRALQANLPAGTAYDAQLQLAGIEVQLHHTSEALGAYQSAADVAPSASKAAEAIWLSADAASNGQDDISAIKALEKLIADYPATQRALDALGDERIAGDPNITPLQKATVNLNHQQNDEATTGFQAIVAAGGADAAQAQYDLGILSERASDWQAAIDHYDAAINGLAPGDDDELRAQASWDKGTVLERIGLTSDAIDAYAAVADYSDAAQRAPEGLFRGGFLAYRLGRAEDALVLWRRYLTIASTNEDKARADYWLSTASGATGDDASAATYLQSASTDDPLDYYGMRATGRIAGETALPEALTVTPPAADWVRYETWLAGWAGAEDTTATAALFTSDAWLRATELYEAGMNDEADRQWTALLGDNASKPWLEYRLIRKIGEYDRPWVTSPAASTLLSHPGAPPEALQLEYPLEYFSIVQAEAAANGLSPLFLLALVRQESLYDRTAVSSAQAMGLTQVVPDTATGIAQELGITNFKPNDLLQARTSLKFGAHYLGGILAGFGGSLPATAAGYNAGPGAVGAWLDASGGDPDSFLESVDFAETRTFVEVVMENYARYLYAYGVTDSPTLPLG